MNSRECLIDNKRFQDRGSHLKSNKHGACLRGNLIRCQITHDKLNFRNIYFKVCMLKVSGKNFYSLDLWKIDAVSFLFDSIYKNRFPCMFSLRILN